MKQDITIRRRPSNIQLLRATQSAYDHLVARHGRRYVRRPRNDIDANFDKWFAWAVRDISVLPNGTSLPAVSWMHWERGNCLYAMVVTTVLVCHVA